MSNYNFVEELIQDGLDMLATSFIYGEFAKQVPPANMTVAQEKRYRYSLFTNAQSYQMWVNSVLSIGLDESDAIAIFGAVKAASYRLLANYRAGKFQQTTVSNNEVVVDRVAELEAELAAVKASETAKSLEIRDLKAEVKTLVHAFETMNNKVIKEKSRTVMINGVLTKIVVPQEVGF